MDNPQTSTITKPAVRIRTLITIGVLVLGAGILAAAAAYYTYSPSSNTYSTNTYVNNQTNQAPLASNISLTIDNAGSPPSSIVLVNQQRVTFLNVKFSAKNEPIRIDQVNVCVGDGGYEFNAGVGEYRDLYSVSFYYGTTELAKGIVPSTGCVKLDLSSGRYIKIGSSVQYVQYKNEIIVPKDGSKIFTIKGDMSTVDPETDNAPGTNSADVSLGLGGENGIEARALISQRDLSWGEKIYRSSTSSAMILRSGRPIVTLPSGGGPFAFGADDYLTNGPICPFAFKVWAETSGRVFLYRNTFVFAFGGASSMSFTGVHVIHVQTGKVISPPADPVPYKSVYGNEFFYVATYDEPIAIPVIESYSKIFKVCGIMTGAKPGTNFSTFLAGDTVYRADRVNIDNVASFYKLPVGDSDRNSANFIWSDNYRQKSVSESVSAPQWYNGHLVPGLENAVRTTPYVIGWY